MAALEACGMVFHGLPSRGAGRGWVRALPLVQSRSRAVMLSNRLAFAALAVACIGAAAGGGYLASRQNAVPTPASAQIQTQPAAAPAATPAPQAAPAPKPV